MRRPNQSFLADASAPHNGIFGITIMRDAAMTYVNKRNDAEIQRIRNIAEGGSDGSVLMLNFNYYSAEAGFPNGALYKTYIAVLANFLPAVGAKILWKHPFLARLPGNKSCTKYLPHGIRRIKRFLICPVRLGLKRIFAFEHWQ